MTVDTAVSLAAQAFPAWSARSDRAEALDALADALDARVDELVAVADEETALGEPRLRGEVGRTSGQLRMFAGVLRDGGYVDAIISPADPAKARPDVRRMLHPMGPVAVFAASNFPFAFSVCGGDTASALASGCPVVVKAHEGHPRTSALVAQVAQAVLPEHVLQVVYGFEAGPILVRHKEIRAVGFTGSTAGGRALFDLAARRPDPIPFYGELGSVNPVVILPGAAAERAQQIAKGYSGSLTLGVGQFCTNPGLLFAPEGSPLVDAVAEQVRASTGGTMLTEKIHDGYLAGTAAVGLPELAQGVAAQGKWAVAPRVWQVNAATFVARQELAEEIFGPAGMVITYRDLAELHDVLALLPGSLTGSIHAIPAESAELATVSAVLRPRSGRLIHNGWPTGVAVCWAMHHGGPYPASTAAAHTSVGATAIRRWLTPVAYQDWPDELLPPELQRANPLNIPRIEKD